LNGHTLLIIFSEREVLVHVRYNAIARPSVICLSSVVCRLQRSCALLRRFKV